MTFYKRAFVFVFSAFLLFNIAPAVAQNLPAELAAFAHRVALAPSDQERDALLLENNEKFSPSDLRKAISQEALQMRVEGRYDKALEIDLFTKRFAEKNGDRTGVGAALNNAGVNYQETGRYREAIEYYKRALEIRTALNDKAGIGSSGNNLGLALINLGEYDEARRHLENSRKIFVELSRPDGVSVVLNNLGIIQRRLGNGALAAVLYAQSLALCEGNKNKYGASLALSNLATIKREDGDYAAALDYERRSLALREELKNARGIAISLSSLGNTYLELKDYPQALAFYERKLKIDEEIKAQEGIAVGLADIAEVKFRMNDLTAALSFADRALAIAEKIGDEEILWNVQRLRGAIFRSLKQTVKARESLTKAIDMIETRRRLSFGQMNNYFSNKIVSYHDALELEVEAGANAAALEYAERGKARALIDILSSKPSAIGKNMTNDEKAREIEINNRISLLNAEMLRERSRAPQPDGERIKKFESELEKAYLDNEMFQSSLYQKHPEIKIQRGDARIITLAEIASTLLTEPDRALLEYVVTEAATYLFVITKTNQTPEISIYKLAISEKDLIAKTTDFRRRIATRDEYEKAARELFALFVAPAQMRLKGKSKIVVVPDGALWNLPFQALKNSQNRFLLEDFAVSYAPSLTALRDMRKASQKLSVLGGKDKTLLAFGNPSFPKAETAAQQEALTLRGGEILAPLPDAELEVFTLSKLYGAGQSRIYVREEAREDRAKSEAKGFKILQFAAHGVFNDANPLYSYLLLSPNAAAGDDGLLEARELMNLDLSADLVVLSACETARGRVSKGEGLTGMTWALFVAGVPTTVASQWKIPSAATTEIMLNFHRNLLKQSKNASKAEALRQAELDYFQKSDLKHPFYWAGFVVIGKE